MNYYAQRDYYKQHKRWAKTLAVLGLQKLRHDSLSGPPTQETTTSLFQVTMETKPANAGIYSKVWKE